MENPSIMTGGTSSTPKASQGNGATAQLQVVTLEEAIKELTARFEADKKAFETHASNHAAQMVTEKVNAHMAAVKAGAELQAHVGESATKTLHSAFTHRKADDAYKAGYAAVDAAVKDLLSTKKLEGEEAPSFHIKKKHVYYGAAATAVAAGVGTYVVVKVAHNAGVKAGLAMQIDSIYKASR